MWTSFIHWRLQQHIFSGNICRSVLQMTTTTCISKQTIHEAACHAQRRGRNQNRKEWGWENTSNIYSLSKRINGTNTRRRTICKYLNIYLIDFDSTRSSCDDFFLVQLAFSRVVIVMPSMFDLMSRQIQNKSCAQKNYKGKHWKALKIYRKKLCWVSGSFVETHSIHVGCRPEDGFFQCRENCTNRYYVADTISHCTFSGDDEGGG